jgi:outer membrane protein assembly factor BamB
MRQAMGRRQALAEIGVTVAGLATVTACGRLAAEAAASKPAAGGRVAGTLLWRSQAAVSGDDEPMILTAAGTVYATGGGHDYGDSGIYAFDAATGRELWRTPGSSGPRPFTAGPGAVFGFTVTPGGRTEVVATSATNRRTLWTRDVGQLLDNAKVGWMAYSGGLVYVAAATTEDSTAGQPTIRVLDARTGARAWEATTGAAPQTPAIADGIVYTGAASSASAASGAVVALNGATGKRIWRSADVGGSPIALAVTGGVVCGSVLTSSLRSVSFGLDARTGRQLWRMTVPAAALAGTESILFFLTFSIGPDLSYAVQARHARTGVLAWKRTFPGQTALAANRGVLYLGSGDRTLRALEAATGQPVWTYRLRAPASAIATDASAVYALDERGAIYGLRA